jgi:hypothetical protein
MKMRDFRDLLEQVNDWGLDLQEDGWSWSDITEALLIEVGLRIEAAEDSDKTRLRKLVSDFSSTCATLVEPARINPRWN